MIGSTVAFAVHILVSSFRVLKPVSVVLEYAWPLYRNMSTKSITNKINFNTKHLVKGDPLPAFNGKLRIYNMRYCPYAQRTILVLNAKNIDYEVVNINLKDKPDWLTTKSPLGKVPALEIADNLVIFESLVTAEYLDEVFPQRPLVSKDPIRKAMDKIIIEIAGSISTIFSSYVRDLEISEATLASYYKALDYVQDQLKSRGTTFLGGDEPGFVDYMIWPWFEKLDIFDVKETHFRSPKYHLLVGYVDSMYKDPAVAQYLVPKDILRTVFNGYKPGNTPNYDILLGQ